MGGADVPLFDEFSAYYDQFVNWKTRLANEMPFLREALSRAGARRVLDAACGTGMHTVALAGEGYEVVCAEPSEGMLRRVAENALRAGVKVAQVKAGFGELRQHGLGLFDAVLCLGNSLPHALTHEDLVGALADFHAVLRPGGVAIIQNRNYDKVLMDRIRFMPLETAETANRELLFLRFVDFGDELLTFNVVTLIREDGRWRYEVGSTKHRPITVAEAESALMSAGFASWDLYGDYQFSAFDPARSGDLIVVARR